MRESLRVASRRSSTFADPRSKGVESQRMRHCARRRHPEPTTSLVTVTQSAAYATGRRVYSGCSSLRARARARHARACTRITRVSEAGTCRAQLPAATIFNILASFEIMINETRACCCRAFGVDYRKTRVFSFHRNVIAIMHRSFQVELDRPEANENVRGLRTNCRALLFGRLRSSIL